MKFIPTTMGTNIMPEMIMRMIIMITITVPASEDSILRPIVATIMTMFTPITIFMTERLTAQQFI